jgi:hypothetical protein
MIPMILKLPTWKQVAFISKLYIELEEQLICVDQGYEPIHIIKWSRQDLYIGLDIGFRHAG